MGAVACVVHGNTPKEEREKCIVCMRAERDFLMEEVTSLAAMIETPATKHYAEARALVQKLTDRGVTKLNDPAVAYHLCLLISSIEKRCR